MRATAAFALLAVGSALGACGGESPATSGAPKSELEQQIDRARRVSAADFPAPRRRSLQAIADGAEAGPQLGLATSVFVPGRNRLAFGVLGADNEPVYGRSAVYVARTPADEARGPFPAPADPVEAEPRFRSQTQAHAGEGAIVAIQSATVPFPRTGKHAVLVLTEVDGRWLAAATQIEVQRGSPIPNVGEPAPAIETPTVASAGRVEEIDTRVPPDTMHDESFRDVVGRRPVALLFATPALCESRVCGPVVDIAEQLKATYGDRMAFIHQEVYVDNEVAKGLRPQLASFDLRSEPWLFTFDREGRVAARLEGSFGVDAFRRAIEAAL